MSEKEEEHKPVSDNNNNNGGRSSKHVFLQYVSHDINGEPDVSGIFSKECYMTWLDTRARPPLRPEESFRKALIAHVAGKDKRKPFSEEIERKLLKRLREHEAWPAFKDCTNGCQKIGERGINSLGYHEQKNQNKDKIQGKARNESEGDEAYDEDSAGSYPDSRLRKRKKVQNEDQGHQHLEVLEEDTTLTDLSNSDSGALTNYYSPGYETESLNYSNSDFNNYSLADLQILYAKLKNNFHQRAARSLISRNAATDFLRFLYHKDKTFRSIETSTSSEILCHFLLSTYTDAQLGSMAMDAAAKGREIFSESMQQQLDNCPSELGYFYSEEFLCPTSNVSILSPLTDTSFDMFSYFSNNKPIGRFVWRADGIIIDSNEAANKMLDPTGRSLVGRNSNEFLLSILHQFLVTKYVVPKVCMGREYKLFRTIVNLKGIIRVFRNVYTNDSLNNFDICFQEETEVFREQISKELLFL